MTDRLHLWIGDARVWGTTVHNGTLCGRGQGRVDDPGPVITVTIVAADVTCPTCLEWMHA